MEMNEGNNPYKNDNIKYTKNLFKDIPKAVGKLVAIGNGGYNTKFNKLDFGYRVYFNSKNGVFNCQVYSEANEKLKEKPFKEYSVTQKEDTSLTSVITAILYNEYVARTMLKKKKIDIIKIPIPKGELQND